MIENIQAALVMLTSWKLLLTITLCSIFGLFVGAVPGRPCWCHSPFSWCGWRPWSPS
ncbi:MAG: hypothetical protein HYW08_12395 [candidate division NC10 bacterium]|nr:hypothetical protein [candidate division NC10 bacterium]